MNEFLVNNDLYYRRDVYEKIVNLKISDYFLILNRFRDKYFLNKIRKIALTIG